MEALTVYCSADQCRISHLQARKKRTLTPSVSRPVLEAPLTSGLRPRQYCCAQCWVGPHLGFLRARLV